MLNFCNSSKWVFLSADGIIDCRRARGGNNSKKIFENDPTGSKDENDLFLSCQHA